ncbi:hypothetical protein SDC9_104854 [bioreactor metagenome]|uniref:Uncharacterized protein n=1 Tax=bioreactor metagenome TaxID=1076179 RepID=A0A645AXQ3_9ZZZZ
MRLSFWPLQNLFTTAAVSGDAESLSKSRGPPRMRRTPEQINSPWRGWEILQAARGKAL